MHFSSGRNLSMFMQLILELEIFIVTFWYIIKVSLLNFLKYALHLHIYFYCIMLANYLLIVLFIFRSIEHPFNMLSQAFYIIGRLCASRRWEVIFVSLALIAWKISIVNTQVDNSRICDYECSEVIYCTSLVIANTFSLFIYIFTITWSI